MVSAAQALEEGNQLDRTIFSFLIFLSFHPDVASTNWRGFVTHNLTWFLFLFALISVVWSDFPFIAFKRWFRDLGNYFMILVVLSDPHPFEAVRTLLRRTCYLLIPLSVLLVKYYRSESIHYSIWTGEVEYVGVATSKNMLGVMCLISGIFFFWDFVIRWPDRRERRTKLIIVVDIAFMAMTLWLLTLSSSATSSVCLAIGCLVIVAANTRLIRRHPGVLKFLIPVVSCAYLVLALGFDINGNLAGAVGRDPTLTGRSNIWKAVLSTHTNPIFGTGYESFWLGSRLEHVWQLAGHVNEAHNGYLELYLNLGIIGVFLLFIFMVASYLAICKRLSPSFGLATLGLALWTIMVFYNMTESAAFKGQFLWITFLLVVIVISAHSPKARETTPAKVSQPEKFPFKLRERVGAGIRG